jgi:hypothetical protein
MTEAANIYCTLNRVDPDLKKKDKYVSFRLLLSEVAQLKALAQAENKNVSRFIRSRIFPTK